MALSKQHRLGSNRDFGKVHRSGLRASTQHLAMRALNTKANEKPRPKLKPKKKFSRGADVNPSALSRVQNAELCLAEQQNDAHLRGIEDRAGEDRAGEDRASAIKSIVANSSAANSSAADSSAVEKAVEKAVERTTEKATEKAAVIAPSQFGISISKKVSKRAVVRNRIKRQIKAVLHRFMSKISPGWKVVIVVRPSAVECEFADFLRELEYLLKKLRITDTHS